MLTGRFFIVPLAAITLPAPVPAATPQYFAVAGACIAHIPENGAEGLPSLALSFIPKIVGAGFDALTRALKAAGADKSFTRTVLAPLEYRPRCIQVVSLPAMPAENVTTDALQAAPFLLEFYLRPSEDRSSLLVMPTLLNYERNFENGGTGGRPRHLFATLIFDMPEKDGSQTVTIPLGDHQAGAGSRNIHFMPVGAPQTPRYPLGMGTSAWIKMPFVSVPARVGPTGANQALPDNQANSDGPGVDSQPPIENGFDEAATAPKTATTPPLGSEATDTPPRTGWLANPIEPATVTVVITETRPGSKFAAALANILEGSREDVVNTLDPAKIREEADAKRSEHVIALKSLTTNIATLAEKYQAYCSLKDADSLSSRTSAAVALYGAQLDVVTSAKEASVPAPPIASNTVSYVAPLPERFCSK